MEREDLKLLIITLVVIAFFINIFLLVDAFSGDKIDSLNASRFGSFIGGYFGTIISSASAILLYITLKNQRKAYRIDQFESKYFEMINIYISNVSETYLQDSHGRKVFITLFREYREIFNVLSSKLDIEIESKIDIAYKVFFYGLGPNSARQLKCALQEYDDNLRKQIIKLACKVYEEGTSRKFKHKIIRGHQSRLGYYYRQMYNLVKYVDSRDFLNENEKYEYIKMFRCQISTHELALLKINTISDLGMKWYTNEYISKYKLFKNIPSGFFKSKELPSKSDN